ncbi:TonB-dependent receptor [Ralstonia syzygii subsp. celebesensis]|uniref:TonB-dependent receptor n=2 Tax=Ralstonia syzygii subsp. celebesensis TaxID=1310168 RepID=A0A1U9VG96_9RALS|nr:TonB-dependent receptor [Ralstonia syzygii]AQW29712.1 TonB-dependent receptor [blood disease bacterium A2-HR MARDI]QQV56423.1 TonB-dependent receptor [Ralstonia syzygii subsp. celebesensis]CCA80120.1 putative TonB-dependent receptor [blood disease bacterium R229]
MIPFQPRALVLALAAALPSLAAVPALAQEAANPAAAAASSTSTAQATASNVRDLSETRVTAKRLDAARNALSPDTGSSVYRFDTDDIARLPLGDATPLNQVLLQAPGVVQDSFGQLHVRGDHANLQYRINGVIIPEPISGFGQVLDTRFANQINVLTGALPAQYGYRTAGIVDIQTKGAATDEAGEPKAVSGEIGTVLGSRATHEVNAQLQGTKDRFSYYLSGVFAENNLGIENPTGNRNATHDHTTQNKSFGMLSYLLDNDSRVSFMFGTANSRFQIPTRPGLQPQFTLDGVDAPASEALNANQREKTDFQILTYQQKVSPKLDYQVSVFRRASRIDYSPDPVGDLVYNGVASDVSRRNEAYGVQGDASYKLNDRHTLRAGLFVQRERFAVDNASTVFPADSTGAQTSGTPFTVIDNSSGSGTTLGAYLQDEWKPTDRLTINYGARYDHVNTIVSEQQLSPRLGLTYDLTSRTRLHAGYARYFTPPPTEKFDTTTVQKFIGTTNALPSDANTAVKSERSNYFDLGISHQLTPHLTLGLDAYYRDVRHLQDEGQFGNALLFSAFNYERGRIYGLEASANYREGSFGAYLNLGVSRAQGKGIETGQFHFDDAELAYINSHWVNLDHDQRLTASAGVSYKYWGTTWLADALFGSGLRNGFANTDHLPAYWQLNLGAARDFNLPLVGKLKTRLTVLNVLDRSYALRDGTGIGVGAPQFAPRRTFLLSVSKPF